MKKRIINYLIIMVAFSISSCSSDEVIDNNEKPIVDTDSQYVKSRIAGDKLLKSFGNSETRTLTTNEYPDFYGGGYIDKEGKLNIFIKKEFTKHRNNLIDITGDEDVIYTEGEYSYKELKNVLESISEFIDNNPESLISSNIKCHFLNDYENNVVVELGECNELKIEEFRNNVLNFPGIIFKESTREFIEHALKPGDKILANISGGYYPNSVGFRAKQFGTIGYIAAGHGFSAGSNVYDEYRKVIGFCNQSVHSGKTDAAFIIPTDFNYSPNNSGLTGEDLTMWAGDQVSKKGSITFETHGYIISTSVSVSSTNQLTNVTTRLSDMFEYSNVSAPGDSGGPIYLSSNNKLMGIHQGGASFSSIGCKLINIKSSLSVTYY